ncbi:MULTISPECIES: TIGR04222 domain-containing membrane protein [unclassified Actinomadura]|uniref:TIGR04222 domain-containing membrane protein n=1 Tax=unclassified Actinomadura TaxID=2626254 RepID=UPI002739356B|nr:TIGR04222 domain-containing membrane protein [Actinomadura sp. K4S16]
MTVSPRGVAVDEFTPYEIALLCGGPTRAAQCALLTLYEGRRVRVSRGTRRVTVVKREADDKIQAALLEEVPDTGFQLGYVLDAVAESDEMAAIAGGLVERGLLRRGFRGKLRRTRKGRAARRRLRAHAESGAPSGLGALKGAAPDAVTRLAALGTAAVEDAKLRQVMEMDNPKPLDLPYDWALNGVRRGPEPSPLSETKYSGYAWNAWDTWGNGPGPY